MHPRNFESSIERSEVVVRALPEGTIFRPFEPVLEVEGHYSAFAVLETPLLGVLCQASGVATAAARCRKAAGERPLLSFGARRMHPAISPMIERSAFIGGCDGVAVVKSAELLGQQALYGPDGLHDFWLRPRGKVAPPARCTELEDYGFIPSRLPK